MVRKSQPKKVFQMKKEAKKTENASFKNIVVRDSMSKKIFQMKKEAKAHENDL